MFDPGPDGSAHLFGDHEYDLAMGEGENPNEDRPEVAVDCRYRTKRAYRTRGLAQVGAADIKRTVQALGRVYDPLHEYRCPDGDHWHLSHYQQGHTICPVCRTNAPAWNGGRVWVISAHTTDGERCSGEGAHA